MESYRDVKRFLLKFGIIIYIGNRRAEIELSLIELRALRDESAISASDYLKVSRILINELEN
ncbi:YqgQ family protein [Amphibacillus jilinensis]|uniref:YqgQ family protein n=1 Tax=Amphibacillus jilinensis TaxID=1216008 RepID=UPI000318FDEF|nr:YqgQ family protein [Amphibacillus jilinensis]